MTGRNVCLHSESYLTSFINAVSLLDELKIAWDLGGPIIGEDSCRSTRHAVEFAQSRSWMKTVASSGQYEGS